LLFVSDKEEKKSKNPTDLPDEKIETVNLFALNRGTFPSIGKFGACCSVP
tara:strand:+ start:188 stop:337 length:150 start_codon:yes stop_codon:yes gene_type:complete